MTRARPSTTQEIQATGPPYLSLSIPLFLPADKISSFTRGIHDVNGTNHRREFATGSSQMLESLMTRDVTMTYVDRAGHAETTVENFLLVSKK